MARWVATQMCKSIQRQASVLRSKVLAVSQSLYVRKISRVHDATIKVLPAANL